MNAPLPTVHDKTTTSMNSPIGSKSDLIAVIFAMTFPTLVTLVYFQWLRDSDSSFQQIAFGIGKLLQFGFPVVWVWMWHRSKLCACFENESDRDPQSAVDGGITGSIMQRLIQRLKDSIPQVGIGIGFGILVVASMFAMYFLWIAPSEIGEELTMLVCEKISGMSIDSFWKFVGMGIFYAICHSFLEEYYWRWFVFDFLQKFVSPLAANVLSSLGFMAHHVILLGFFFGWDSPLTYGLSLSIAVGGSVWAWQYKKAGSLLAPWISHMIVDAGIFSLGYVLVRSIL